MLANFRSPGSFQTLRLVVGGGGFLLFIVSLIALMACTTYECDDEKYPNEWADGSWDNQEYHCAIEGVYGPTSPQYSIPAVKHQCRFSLTWLMLAFGSLLIAIGCMCYEMCNDSLLEAEINSGGARRPTAPDSSV